MKVLLDHCVPRSFGRLLAGHPVRTARQAGWARLRNGDLLAAAAVEFDVLVTVDRGIARQQSIASLPLPVVIVIARTNEIDKLAPLAPSVLRLLGMRLDRRVYEVGV